MKEKTIKAQGITDIFNIIDKNTIEAIKKISVILKNVDVQKLETLTKALLSILEFAADGSIWAKIILFTILTQTQVTQIKEFIKNTSVADLIQIGDDGSVSLHVKIYTPTKS